MISFIQYPPPLLSPNPDLCLSDRGTDCSSDFDINRNCNCAERLSGCHLSLAPPPSSPSCSSSFCSSSAVSSAGADVNLHRHSTCSSSCSSCSSDDDNHRRFEEDEPALKSSATVGWPPISSYRKTATLALSSSCRENIQRANDAIANDNVNYANGNDYEIAMPRMIESRIVRKSNRIKVSMDGTPILRKLDLNNIQGYQQLFAEIHKLFKFYKSSSNFLLKPYLCSNTRHSIHYEDMHGAGYILTYKDKDEDWMLIGDTPWEDFAKSAKRIRIMKRK